MDKILITGGTGYVGHRVALSLAERGFPVIVVDIVPPEERGILFPNKIEFRRHDLRIPSEAIEALKGASVVVHLAADIGPLTYMHDHQAEILTNNSAIDAAVYPALIANKVRWITYSSSSMVFQYPPKFPYTEKDIGAIRPPTNVYGFSKLAGEYFCRSYAEQYGLSYTIIRYHNIYGPGEDPKGFTFGDIHVIPALLQKVINGQYPIELLGNPEATRSFIFIDDAVNATVAIVLRTIAGDDVVHNEDFNIGSDKYYKIVDLAKIIWEQYGDERVFACKVIGEKSDTALRREVNTSKMKNLIGWEPTIPLENGLKLTSDWLRNRATAKI